jgi:N-acyl-D-amino-acid deacylase
VGSAPGRIGSNRYGPSMYDLVLQGGTVHDGLGSAGRTADVAIEGRSVVALGDHLGPARRTIDVSGLTVAPGFIDPHSHSDGIPLLDEPQPFKLLQGVTTEVTGNCGFSLAPLSPEAAGEAAVTLGDLVGAAGVRPGSFAQLLERLAGAGPTNHLAVLVGHNTLRLTANGMDRTLRSGALVEMQDLAAEAFAAGAAGLSSGLLYPPGSFSDTDELVALATVAHRFGRPYTTHMRDEGRALDAALDEAIEIGTRARVPVQVSHCKAAGRVSHGRSALLLDRLHRARSDGVDIRGDQYPYLAGSTFLSAMLPAAAHEGGVAALVDRLRDRDQRARLRRQAEDETTPIGTGEWREVTPDDVLVVGHRDRANVGRTLAESTELSGGGDPWDVLCELVIEDPAAMMVITLMAEADVQAIMRDPLISVGSDNGLPQGMQHPRTWGCFPRFLGHYVRDLGVVSWPEAIRKVTSASATQFGLTGRGWLGTGAVADVCAFDATRIGHDGTYLEPDQRPTGVEYVVLAGTVVVDGGEFGGQRRGEIVRVGRST